MTNTYQRRWYCKSHCWGVVVIIWSRHNLRDILWKRQKLWTELFEFNLFLFRENWRREGQEEHNSGKQFRWNTYCCSNTIIKGNKDTKQADYPFQSINAHHIANHRVRSYNVKCVSNLFHNSVDCVHSISLQMLLRMFISSGSD